MALFERHYSVAEANALLPRLRRWFEELNALDARLEPLLKRHGELLAERGNCLGGPRLAEYFQLSFRWQRILLRFARRQILVKDIRRGLCDFPHFLPSTGEEVFLCWELREREVGHWHTLEGGYAGRRPIARAGRAKRP